MSATRGNVWKRVRIKLEDRLRHNLSLRCLLIWLLALFACVRRRRQRLNLWAESHRMAVGLGVHSPAARWLAPWVKDPEKSGVWHEERIGWDRYGVSGQGGSLKKSLIVRYPNEFGKGVIFVWFEYDLLTLLSIRDLTGFLDRYRVVFAGSWSPPCYQVLWSFPPEYRHEFVAGLSHPDDSTRLVSLGFAVNILPLYMSSWQNPTDFHPRIDRDVDIVMIANWAKFKRHWVLFDALRRMRRPDLRVVLIGQPESRRTVDDIRSEAMAFGVAEQIEFFDRVPVTEVWNWLERSRISLILSLREGSCVVVAESLMAGTPVGMLEDAGIGSRDFIYPTTGRFLSHGSQFARQLNGFLYAAPMMSPRPWAEHNISADVSGEVLRKVVDADSAPSLKDLWHPFYCRCSLMTPAKPPEGEMANLAFRHQLELPLSYKSIS